MRYTILLVHDPEGGYVVRVPALRGCVTEGDSLPEALENAREAIAVYLESCALEGIPAPPDRPVIELYDDEEEAWAMRLTLQGEEVEAVAQTATG